MAGAGGVSAGASGGGAGGTSGTAGTSGGSAGAGSGGAPSEPAVHYVGRVDTSDPVRARFAWSGTGVVARFDGTSVAANLGGGQEYTVVIDGTVAPKLVAASGMSSLATGLTAGEHTVELYRRTEAAEGESAFLGFDFGGGMLLAPPPPPARRLEFIGDSITCGYGNEGADMNCPYSPQTENHYLTYAALTARALEAELSTVAWSGKGVVCNYGDDASSCQNPLPAYYELTLPANGASTWDFSRFVPDAVVINLGTNDFSTDSDPSQSEFEAGYRALLELVRQKYPDAYVLCTNGPMLTGSDLSAVRSYIANVVDALGDPRISSFELATQDGSDGYGCDWHPSLARHERMATVVTAELRRKLGW
jgi:lysophospholipase L1-like esterase